MTTVTSSSATTSGTTSSSTSTSTSTSKLGKDFNTFLQLLATQLQNQDPLDPMDTNQFTQQLVMYSQVEQQIGSNSRLDSLVSSMSQMQKNLMTSTSVSYIGKDVTAQTDTMYFDGSKNVRFTYAFDTEPQTAQIKILDSTGQTVRTISANKTTGTNAYTWDGKDDNGQALTAGKYKIQANMFDANGKAITVTTTTPGTVQGIETATDGTVRLNLNGSRQVLLTKITGVQETGTTLAS